MKTTALTLLAQQYLPISPRCVSLLTTDGSGGNPAAVVAVSSAFDPFNRIYFLEWDNPADASSFCLTHSSVPGSRITALALTLSSDGAISCVVQSCGEKKSGGCNNHNGVYNNCDDNNNNNTAAATTYVFRRVESDCYVNEEIEGGRSRVAYKKMPKVMEDDGRSWTAATRLYRGSGDGGDGRIAGACGGEQGAPNALKLLSVAGSRLELQQTIELPTLSTFPVLQMREIDGDAFSLLALCHHAIIEIDPRLKQSDNVVRAWKWTSHDPLVSFATKDNSIIAGTEDGVLVLWDLRYAAVRDKSSGAVDHSTSCGAPVTGLHMPHSTDVLSCHADGSVFTWSKRSYADGGFCFDSQLTDVLPPVFVGSPGCVALAGEDHLAVVADDSGTLSIFSMV